MESTDVATNGAPSMAPQQSPTVASSDGSDSEDSESEGHKEGGEKIAAEEEGELKETSGTTEGKKGERCARVKQKCRA